MTEWTDETWTSPLTQLLQLSSKQGKVTWLQDCAMWRFDLLRSVFLFLRTFTANNVVLHLYDAFMVHCCCLCFLHLAGCVLGSDGWTRGGSHSHGSGVFLPSALLWPEKSTACDCRWCPLFVFCHHSFHRHQCHNHCGQLGHCAHIGAKRKYETFIHSFIHSNN